MHRYRAGKEKEEREGEKDATSEGITHGQTKKTDDSVLKEDMDQVLDSMEEDLGEGEVEKLIAWSQQANYDQYVVAPHMNAKHSSICISLQVCG